jgi:FkbM family methyltransferase
LDYSFRWYLFSSKEPEILNYIDESMDETDIFFDIGANIGVFSLYAAKRHHGLKSYCFEPEFSNLHYLKNNIFENNLTEHIEVYSLAIGDHDGLSKLHIQDKTPGAAMHAENLEHIESTYEGFPVIWQEGIVSRTLDSLCLEMNVIPNVLKIDTDGNEFKILNGAPEILKNEKLRTIIMEVPLVEEFDIKCSRLLKSSGFKIDWEEKNSGNRIWVREDG